MCSFICLDLLHDATWWELVVSVLGRKKQVGNSVEDLVFWGTPSLSPDVCLLFFLTVVHLVMVEMCWNCLLGKLTSFCPFLQQVWPRILGGRTHLPMCRIISSYDFSQMDGLLETKTYQLCVFQAELRLCSWLGFGGAAGELLLHSLKGTQQRTKVWGVWNDSMLNWHHSWYSQVF